MAGDEMKIRGKYGNHMELTDEEVISIHKRACNYATEYFMQVSDIKARLQLSEANFRKIIAEGKRLTGIEFKATIYRPVLCGPGGGIHYR